MPYVASRIALWRALRMALYKAFYNALYIDFYAYISVCTAAVHSD